MCRLYDEEEFDHMMAPFEVSSLEEQTANTPPDTEEPVFHCWGRKAETGPTSFKVLMESRVNRLAFAVILCVEIPQCLEVSNEMLNSILHYVSLT